MRETVNYIFKILERKKGAKGSSDKPKKSGIEGAPINWGPFIFLTDKDTPPTFQLMKKRSHTFCQGQGGHQ